MKKVLIYSGTTEGRSLSEILSSNKICCDVCVATEYGEQVMEASSYVNVLVGRKTTEEMAALWKNETYACVVDATHPYALEVSANIRNSLKGSALTYIRLDRDTTVREGEGCEFYDSVEECAKALLEKCDDPDMRVMLTTGSRQLPIFCKNEKLRPHLIARVLPDPESLRICLECALEGKQIIAMQGPFTEEVNRALIRQYQATVLVTKDSGKTGGSDTKYLAAQKEGITCCVIRKPDAVKAVSAVSAEEGIYCRRDFEGTVEVLSGILGVDLQQSGDAKAVHESERNEKTRNERAQNEKTQNPAVTARGDEADRHTGKEPDTVSEKPSVRVILAGCGMGGKNAMTQEVRLAIENADYLFGAERLIREFRQEEAVYPYYRAEQILPVLEQAKKTKDSILAVVLFSGDTGFYSGCLKLYAALKETPWVEAQILPGISSISALAARCGQSWQDAVIISTHGIDRSIWEAKLVNAVREGKKVFFLSSGAGDIQLIGRILTDAGLEDTVIHLGYQMSYPEERVFAVSAGECADVTEKGLYTGLLIRESGEERRLIAAFADEDMTRANVPMTKEEIRELSVCKLHLKENAIVYDIGCGTGSVSMEIAALHPSIKVYAIDDNPEAVELTKENAKHLHLSNIEVIEGKAPQALEQLPAPTHAFLGGTKGQLSDILTLLHGKNADTRIVMNAVTMESAGEMSRVSQMVPLAAEEIIQVAVTRTRKAGRYHLMQANNPVFIGSFTMKSKEQDT